MKSIIIITLFLFGITCALPVENELDLAEVEFEYELSNIAALQGLDLPTDFSNNIKQDAYLTTPQLLKKYGYESEIHPVTTEDGYILEMHRIPKPGAIPVYLQHGIMDSSGGWVIMGPHTAFAYFLADLGYDVWMGNVRGNRYSRKHVSLKPRKAAFWDFTFHEMGQYDLPAMIDHVSNVTGFEKMHYIGHSQGTTAFWAMCDLRPEYCGRILSMQAMAPIAYMRNVKSPLLRIIAPFTNQIGFIAKLMGANEFLPTNELLTLAGQILCNDQAITQVICSNVIFLITGYNSEQLNTTMLPAILGHVPAGAATKQFIHFGQLIKSGRFRRHDYGIIKNLIKYKTIKPPSYDLTKVTAPVALHYSMNDWLADVKDVSKLEKQLPNVIKRYLVPLPKFNHLDFLIAIESRSLVHQDVVKSMRQVENDLGMF